MPTQTVAITGATGFIGRALLHELAGGPWRIRALTRRPAPFHAPCIEWIAGDLDDEEALRKMTHQASAVIHCAGRVRGWSPEQFHHANAQGTATLARICAGRDPQPRFLLISSLAAREPGLSWYAASKHMGEQALMENANGMPWTVFRPTAVYGPGDRELKPLLSLTRYGILLMPGPPGTRFSLLHVKDLTAAVTCWLIAAVHVPGIFELDDGRPGGYDRHALAAIAGTAWGRPVRPVALPASLIRAAAFLNLWLARVLRYSPILTPGKARELLHPDWVCDNAPLLRSLPGWSPRVGLRDALPQVV